MTSRSVPVQHFTKCDNCGKEVEVATHGRLPNQWFLLQLEGSFYRYPSISPPRKELCKECGDELRRIINKAFPKLVI